MPTHPPPLRIAGARQNNLRDLTLEIPHDAFVVVTGVSGSGKSSLAFDTVFAEGQWRFLESLPAYARLLLEKTVRPEVDAIENVRPAVALEQRNTVRTGRSTVGTLTELYDLFRVLFAAAGTVHCRSCGRPGRSWSPLAAAREAVARASGGWVTVEAPLAAAAGLRRDAWPRELLGRGYARVRVGGEVRRLDEDGLPPEPGSDDTLVIDRVRGLPDREDRLAAAVEAAYAVANGSAVLRAGPAPPLRVGRDLRCHGCDRALPEPRPVLLSFNHALGACPTCTGFGAVLEWDEDKVVPDGAATLGGGAIEPWRTPANRWWQEQLEQRAGAEGIPLDVPWADLPGDVRDRVWRGTGTLEGVEDFFSYLETKRYKMHVRVFLARYRKPVPCPDCGGARLGPDALSVRVGGRTIADVAAMDLASLNRWVGGLADEIGDRGREVLWRIEARIGTLLRLGLHYLTMDRPSRTLSGGEAQRAALALQLQNHLVGATYVLDEPTVGLHARDVEMLAGVLGDLVARGNTVLVVEHDPDLVRRADHVIELGPGGGRDGGTVLYQGPPGGLARTDTPTGRQLARPPSGGRDRPVRTPAGHLTLRGCRLHNLRDLEAAFPLGVLACVTGVSGSGKSTLVAQTLAPAASTAGGRGPVDAVTVEGAFRLRAVRTVDQEPMGRSPRSIPLTYVGAYDGVRKAFAAQPACRALGLGPRDFSFNVTGGRCERCKGTGHEKVEMFLFEDLYVPCEGCGGRRFRPEVLAVRYRGRTIHDVLSMTVAEGLELFRGVNGVERALAVLGEMGLGYLVLGQPAPTLSGGEAQRLKIAAELLGRRPRGVLYLLDEPTTGLHPDDVDRLCDVLDQLVDAGNTVVAVEHNLGFIARADWVIDLGPEGGADGGRIVDTGTPEAVAGRALGPTGRHLARFLAGRGAP